MKNVIFIMNSSLFQNSILFRMLQHAGTKKPFWVSICSVCCSNRDGANENPERLFRLRLQHNPVLVKAFSFFFPYGGLFSFLSFSFFSFLDVLMESFTILSMSDAL